MNNFETIAWVIFIVSILIWCFLVILMQFIYWPYRLNKKNRIIIHDCNGYKDKVTPKCELKLFKKAKKAVNYTSYVVIFSIILVFISRL